MKSPEKASAELGERLAWERAMKTSVYTKHSEYLKMMATYGAEHKDFFLLVQTGRRYALKTNLLCVCSHLVYRSCLLPERRCWLLEKV